MKKIILGCLGVVVIVIMVMMINSNPVKKVFDKDWPGGNMSQENKEILEKYFHAEGYDDPAQYWGLCADEGGDTIGRKNPWTIAPVSPIPLHVNVYIDNSSSMKGYFESPNVAPLIGVLSGITQYYQSGITGYYIEKNAFKKYEWDQLTADLTAKKLSNYSDAFQLDGLIRHIMDNYTKESIDNNVINFILTDGVPSGTNDEIRNSAQRQFNKTSASLLQTRIATAFGGIHGIAASVYQFTSGFDGKYWFYNNDTSMKHWPKHPFYLIVVGNKDLVMGLAEKEASGLQFFKANNKVHFGAVNENKFILSSTVFELGTYTVSSTAFDEEEREELNINVQLSLSGLPYFARTQDFLENNMMLEFDDKAITNFKVEGKMLTIPLHVRQFTKYRLSVKIMNTTPSWVDIATSLDDKREKDSVLAIKTFNLKYLVEGIKNAITGSKGDVILFQKEFLIDTDEHN